MNKTRKLVVIAVIMVIVAVVLIAVAVAIAGVEDGAEPEYGVSENATVSVPTPMATQEKLTFSSEPIPEDVRVRMWNVTISDKSPVTFDDLSYLTISFIGYDGETHVGNMVVAASLAEEVLSIFRELYQVGFPIEKMVLPCEYGGVDENSMTDNNTSAFNDRPLNESGALSYHQLGTAIDINPLYNPYINLSTLDVQPAAGEPYLDRGLSAKGMIFYDGECVRIFKKYGWTWGGDWNSVKDYQHFEKHL